MNRAKLIASSENENEAISLRLVKRKVFLKGRIEGFESYNECLSVASLDKIYVYKENKF